MSRILIGTDPVQVLAPNARRTKWEVEFLPSSVVAGNTGLVFLGIGNPPGNSLTRTSYDAVMNAGASNQRNTKDGHSEMEVKNAIWLQADTADQVCLVREDLSEGV